MLKLNNISFEYDKKTKILNDFNLEVFEGEIVSIKGKSGLGKSTILRLIAGLEKPNVGTIVLEGEDITKKPTHKRSIGYVFQNHALFPHLTVRKNIEYGLKTNKKEQVAEIAKVVDIEGLLERYPHEISGGQKQRVAIARSLVTNPKILLMDEPFTGLDEELKNTVRKDIHKILTKLKITTILVTHDIQDAINLNARLITID